MNSLTLALRREKNINISITGQSGVGRGKDENRTCSNIRLISSGKKYQMKETQRGVCYTPKQMCNFSFCERLNGFYFIFFLNQTHPWCSITRERLMIVLIKCSKLVLGYFVWYTVLSLPICNHRLRYSPLLFFPLTPHASMSVTRQGYVNVITLLTFLLWQITKLRFTSIFSYRLPNTKFLTTS